MFLVCFRKTSQVMQRPFEITLKGAKMEGRRMLRI